MLPAREPLAALRRGVLLLQADLPYFPGRHGCDFFNVRHLASRYPVGVVGPLHKTLPREGVENLRRTVTACYFWPEELADLTDRGLGRAGRLLRRGLLVVPGRILRPLFTRLVDLERDDDHGLMMLAALSNWAPYLLKALKDRQWSVLVLVQSDTATWLDYLPPHLPTAVYFHDVRGDYLERCAVYEADPVTLRRSAHVATRQEQAICDRVDAVGFVSALDAERAAARYGPLPHAHAAELPLDLDYYQPRPPARPRPQRSMVLFTGHLSHPPNVDAVRFFLREVWGPLRRECPGVVFQVVGAFPSPEVVEACAATEGVELHPNVPDIRPFFWDATAYVVPMRFGGGVRQKVLEAWALGVPVVLTSMAAEGLPARDGLNCIVADEASIFAGRLAALLRGQLPTDGIVEAGREAVRGHSVAACAPRFEAFVATAVARRRERPFRALLDLSWLRPGLAHPPAPAARGLLRALSGLDVVNSYRVLAPSGTLAGERFPREFRVRCMSSDGWGARRERLRDVVVGALAPFRPTTAFFRLRSLSRLGADVAHTFQDAAPGDIALVPHVRTIHALIDRIGVADSSWEGPERDACLRARRVLCPSGYTRLSLHQRWGIPIERVRVVPPALDPPSSGDVDERRADAVCRGLGASRPFLLCAVSGEDRVDLCASALASAGSSIPSRLVVAILGGWQETRQLVQRLKERGTRAVGLKIRSHRELRALLRGAEAFVDFRGATDFPHLLLESLGAGCPAVTGDDLPRREVAGTAADFCGPAPEPWASAIATLLDDLRRHEQRSADALERAKRFNWKSHAQATIAIYDEVYRED